MNIHLSVSLNLRAPSPSFSDQSEGAPTHSSLSSRSEVSFASSLNQQVVQPLPSLRSISAPLPEEEISSEKGEGFYDFGSLSPHSAPFSTRAPSQLPLFVTSTTAIPSPTQGIFLPPIRPFTSAPIDLT